MKTTLLLHHLLRTFFLCLFCCASLSVLAQGDNDKNTDPDSDPPTRTSAVAVIPYQSSTKLAIIFSEETSDVQVEVFNDKGITVSVSVGTVDANSCLEVDTYCWKRGRYTVRVSVKGKPMSVSAVQLQ